jgi:hypothetical protein
MGVAPSASGAWGRAVPWRVVLIGASFVAVAAGVVLQQLDALLAAMHEPGSPGYGLNDITGALALVPNEQRVRDALSTWHSWRGSPAGFTGPHAVAIAFLLVDTFVLIPAYTLLLIALAKILRARLGQHDEKLPGVFSDDAKARRQRLADAAKAGTIDPSVRGDQDDAAIVRVRTAYRAAGVATILVVAGACLDLFENALTAALVLSDRTWERWVLVGSSSLKWVCLAAAVLKPKALTRMLTRSGPLNIILNPAGTHGFDDLRRKAIREPLGFGVRTTLASLDDIIRTTTASGGKKAEARLPRLHRLLDLAQTIGPDPERFPLSDPRHPRPLAQ